MFISTTKSLLGLGLGATLFFTGCQSDAQRMAPASHAMASDAVACDKCETTWVKVANTSPNAGGRPGFTSYSNQKKMVCPDCKSAVSNFFATGEMKHDCKACGGNMTICKTTHEPS